jgi:hypothetical protein
MGTVRTWLTSALGAALIALQGCGGGGGGGGAPAPAPAAPGTNIIAAAGPNVQPISVDSGLPLPNANSVNLAFTSIRLCAPTTDNCQTIDHIVVDTGSSGLRIMSSVLAASLSLPQQADAKGDPVLECAHFADGYSWGPVKLADLQIAGERASKLPVQIIGDPNFPPAPSRCSATGPSRNSVTELRANGVLGLSGFVRDCGNACALSGSLGIYYTCPAAGCQPAAMPVALQLQQPVSLFAVNNNGVIVELPPVPAAGAASASGSLVFGIGTQANNGLGAATVISVDPGTGNFTTVYNGKNYAGSFIDSGSNALFFQDAGITVCANASTAGFYCPASTKNASATIQGANGATALVDFSVANAATLLASNPGFAAFANLAAPQFVANSFDWGLPFFYGRNVYIAIEGAATPGGPAGPYVAF